MIVLKMQSQVLPRVKEKEEERELRSLICLSAEGTPHQRVCLHHQNQNNKATLLSSTLKFKENTVSSESRFLAYFSRYVTFLFKKTANFS